MDYDHWPDLLTDCLLLSKSDENLTHALPDGFHSSGRTEKGKNMFLRIKSMQLNVKNKLI